MKTGRFGLSFVLLLILPLGCEKAVRQPKVDDGVILSSDVPVRNSTAILAIELARLQRAEEVEILERKGTEWVRVRTKGGIEGWVEARHVLRKRAFEQARALEQEMAAIPAQALGQLTGNAALRLTPGRASDDNILFHVPAGTRVEILRRERTRRMSQELIPRQYEPRWRQSKQPETSLDLWYCVRLPESFLIRIGWVYAPLVELKVPEPLRHLQGEYPFVAWYELARIEDPQVGMASHYLTFDTHRVAPVPGTDFERLRLWVWDLQEHRYKIVRWEIAHGIFPIEHRREGALHRFRMKLYDPRTGALQEAEYLVDVGDQANPRLIRSR